MCSSEIKISIYIFPRWALLFQTSNPLQFLSQQLLVIPPTPTLWNFRDFPTWLGTPWKEYFRPIFPVFPILIGFLAFLQLLWSTRFECMAVIRKPSYYRLRAVSFLLGPSTKTLETQITTSVTEGARRRHEKRVFFSGCRPHFSRLASARVHSPH